MEGGGFLLAWIGEVELITNAVVPTALWGGSANMSKASRSIPTIAPRGADQRVHAFAKAALLCITTSCIPL